MKSNRNEFQYQMSQQMADTLLKTRRGNDKKIENQKYLCRWVNKELGLLGTCTEVLTV